MPEYPMTVARREWVRERLAGLAGGEVRIVAERHVGHRWAPTTRITVDREIPGVGDSVMIKTRRVEGPGHGGPAFLRREAAGLSTASASGVTAELIDFDDATGVVIQSDLGDWPTVQDLLIDGPASDARAGMIALGDAVGRLQAATLGRRDDHRRVLDEFAADVDTGGGYAFGLEAWDRIEETCAELGLPAARAARVDVGALLRRTARPGRFDALIHLDLNPTNVLITDAGARLIDFEGSRFGHLGIDACFLRYPFPHHSNPWGTLPEDVVEAAELAYRTALADGGGDSVLAGYDRMLADGAAIPLIGRILRLRRVADPDQSAADGLRRRGQIVHQIAVFRSLADRAGGLTAFADWLQELAAAMSNRWPEAGAPPPLYPAFAR